MKAVPSLATLALACACASSSQAQQVSPHDLNQIASPPSSKLQQSFPAAPAGKIKVQPDGTVSVGKGFSTVSVVFKHNNTLLVSFSMAGGQGKGVPMTCEDLTKTPDLSGEARDELTLKLHHDLLKAPQGMARVARSVEPFRRTKGASDPDIVGAVIEDIVTQLDEQILLAKLICGSTGRDNTPSPK